MAEANPGRPVRLLVLLVLFGLLQAAALLVPGRLVVDQMWVDALHLLDGAARVAQGQVPHRDFHTPLGTLTFQAIAVWGGAPGAAILKANLLAMALCLPLAVWLGASRLSFGAALTLGLCAMAAAAALTWSAVASGSTPATNYNRWGWAAMILVLPILLVPPRRPGAAADWGDGLALGVAGALVLFMKATFVAALGPAWLVWALTGRGRAGLISLGAAALAAAALVPATGGLEAAAGYVRDLVQVASSSDRAAPGASVAGIASAPMIMPLTLGCLVGALALLRAGLARGAALFLAGSAAIYLAAWQNYGNHPTAAVALPVVLLALVPRAAEGAQVFGWPVRPVLRTLAVGLLALTVPPFLNMERSVFANWGSLEGRARLLPEIAPDIVFEASPPRSLVPAGDGTATTFGGLRFEDCLQTSGHVRALAEAAAVLRADPALRGRTVLVADTTNALWLPAGAPPQQGADIWLYDPPTEALRTADLLAVPRCPYRTEMRAMTLEEARRLGLTAEPVAQTPLWAIFALGR